MDTPMSSYQAPRILIVEDDERLRTLTAEYLQGNGMEVAQVDNGEEAIRLIQRDNPDLVVLDLMLPGVDGLGVCRVVKPAFRNPILMLTARTDEKIGRASSRDREKSQDGGV